MSGEVAVNSGRQGRVGYAPGVFDMFHIGHLNILRNARTACDHLVAGVVSDELAAVRKGRVPVVPVTERIEIVRSIRYVDEAVFEDLPTKAQMWERLRFDVIIKGEDWRNTVKGRCLEAEMEALGVDVLYLPYTAHTSSALLRQALIDEEADLAGS